MTSGISLLEIKSLPTVAGTMEGGLWIGLSSLRTTQSSVCVYINIPLLREEKGKERTEIVGKAVEIEGERTAARWGGQNRK